MNKHVKLMVNLLFSLACLLGLKRYIGWQSIEQTFAQMPWEYALIALLSPVLLSVPHVVRWQFAARALQMPLSFTQGLRLVYVGYFFNQVLPTSFGGDFFRMWELRKQGASLSQAVSSVMLDRIVPLMALCLLFVVTYPSLRALIPWPVLDGLWGLLGAGLLTLAVLAYFRRQWIPWCEQYAWAKPFKGLIEASLPAWQWSLFIGLCILIHMGIGVTFYFLAKGLGIEVLSLYLCICLFPLINLVTMIPLSFAGWGVREGVLVFTLAYVGVEASEAFALSIVYGLGITLASLPGLLAWWYQPSGRLQTA